MAKERLRVPLDALVSRLDVAVTIEFLDPLGGRAVLAGIGLMRMPRCKPEIHGHPAETVYFKAVRGQRKHCRIYDCGMSRDRGEPGRWLRFEDQRRYPSGRRPRATAVSAEMVKSQFRQRFAPLVRASEGVMIGGPSMIARELVALVRSEALSVREAEGSAGLCCWRRREGACTRHARSTVGIEDSQTTGSWLPARNLRRFSSTSQRSSPRSSNPSFGTSNESPNIGIQAATRPHDQAAQRDRPTRHRSSRSRRRRGGPGIACHRHPMAQLRP